MLKKILTDRYIIIFDTDSGIEIISGINDYPDPWILDHPVLMDIGIVASCGNQCGFCYQGDGVEPNMSIRDYKRLIWNVRNHVNQVALGGRGNPDEHESFYEILAYTRQCGIVPNYTTAGNNFTPEKAEISKMCGAVAVSMYEKPYTFSTINMLLNAGVKTNIHWILSTDNIDKIVSFLKGSDPFDGKVDIDSLNAVIFLLFKPCGRGANHPELVPSDNDISEFISCVRKYRGIPKIGMDSCLVGRVSKVSQLTDDEKLYMDTCEGARMSCYVTPDLKMLPCSFGLTISDGIDIRSNSVSVAWNSDIFNDFRNKLRDNPYVCPWTGK